MAADQNLALTFPSIVAILDERFDPKAVQISQTEWKTWGVSADAEVRERIQARLHPLAIALSAREWLPLRGLLFEAMGAAARQAAECLEAAPPYAPHDLIALVPEPLAGLVMRFRSANNCPVDRIHVQRKDWNEIRPLALQAFLTEKAKCESGNAAAKKSNQRSSKNAKAE